MRLWMDATKAHGLLLALSLAKRISRKMKKRHSLKVKIQVSFWFSRHKQSMRLGDTEVLADVARRRPDGCDADRRRMLKAEFQFSLVLLYPRVEKKKKTFGS